MFSRCPLFDIAILEVTDCPKCHDAFPLQKNGIHVTKPGDRVEAIGFPLGQDNIKMSRGIVSGHQFNKYQIDSPINPGNSGGPVLRDGKVIGIVSSGIFFSNDIGYAVPIERYFQIKHVMKKKYSDLPTKILWVFSSRKSNHESRRSVDLQHFSTELYHSSCQAQIENRGCSFETGKVQGTTKWLVG